MNLLSRLAEAITWSAQTTSPPGRQYAFTPALEPPIRMWGADRSKRAELLEASCEKRSVLLRELGVEPTASPELSGGRILAFCLDDNIGCGVCQEEVGWQPELFDDENIPGWDTWFALHQHPGRGQCLLCWIRQADVAAVERAMMVEPAECMFWLDGASLIQAELGTAPGRGGS